MGNRAVIVPEGTASHVSTHPTEPETCIDAEWTEVSPALTKASLIEAGNGADANRAPSQDGYVLQLPSAPVAWIVDLVV